MITETIGSRLVAERKRLQLTQAELADLLSVTPLTARNYEKDETHIPSDKLKKLSLHSFDVNYIITGKTGDVARFEKLNNIKNNEIKNTMGDVAHFSPREGITINPDDYAWVPLYDVKVSAGHGVLTDNENILTWLSFSKYSLRKQGLSPKNLAAVIVHGDSMHDTLRANDCIVIDLTKRDPDGGIFVVRIGDALHVKRLILEKDSIRVISDNSRYREWSLDNNDDFEIIGRYEWLGRYSS